MAGVVIVGAGLGALRAAESLRGNGFDGPITVLGEEPHLPYNRPPLSKEALRDGLDDAALEFRRKASVDDVDWRVGTPVTSADLRAQTVTLADGGVLSFDGLVAATGIRPRRLPIPGPQGGRFVLRTAEDARAIRAHLRPGAHLVVMGAGFIGCEVAATARSLGAQVTVVALDDEPMVRPLGTALGSAMRRHHEQRGVHFRMGTSISAFHGDPAEPAADRVVSATLSDGTEIPADLVIEAVGSVPNVGWLDGNALDLSNGILCDSSLQVVDAACPVVAVGDVARYPLALTGRVPLRIEHWNMPTETGRRAGRTLASLLAGSEPDRSPFAAMPSFWSDQYDIALQSFGVPGPDDEIHVVDGDVEGSCIVEFHDDEGLAGVVGVNRTPDLGPYRRRLMERIG